MKINRSLFMFSVFAIAVLTRPDLTPLQGAEDLSGRVGITGQAAEIGLREAILSALENNPAFRVSREEVAVKEYELLGSQGIFDPLFESSSTVNSDTVPVGSVLAGGSEGTLRTKLWDQTLALRQNLPFGAAWSARFSMQRTESSNLFVQLDPQYPTFLGVDFSMPLLKNRTIDQKRLQIKLAAKNIGLSREDLQNAALGLITEVRVAYWNLIFAREAAGVAAESVRLAREQVERNQRLVGAGQAADVDVIEAQAVLERRLGELISVKGEVTRSENSLKRLILDGRDDQLWSAEIVPTDRKEQGYEDLSISSAWTIAQRSRPEFAQLATQSEMQELTSRYLENQEKPGVELVASVGLHGLAGSERPGGNPFSYQNIPLYERVNVLSEAPGLDPLAFPSFGGVPSHLLGGIGDSFGNLFSGDYKLGQIGVRVTIPVRNRTAEGQLAVSRQREKQIEARRSSLEQQVEAEIRNALQAVETVRERLKAATASREASEARLESEQRLFSAGETTNFLVLSRQAFYVEARGAEVRAEMDLNIAIANLQRVLGNAATTFNVAFTTP